MPKKRKTRKQKIQTAQKKDMALEIEPLDTPSQKIETQSPTQKTATTDMTFSFSTTPKKPATPKSTQQMSNPVAISTSEYGYLLKDLMKTAIVTGAIVIAELLIRLFYLHL
ncbi:MAG TPA: hypothetical protein VNW29_05965 [Candidatus Sulfotelmatobacter sp.]|jgi:hypothetical protein|nr:hypothetical protein [Candidatus Sulfotelmatobacter sp.]